MTIIRRGICNMDGCWLSLYYREMCYKHYRWWRDNGMPLDINNNYIAPAELNEKVRFKNGDFFWYKLARKRALAEENRERRLEHKNRSNGQKSRHGPDWVEHYRAKMEEKVAHGVCNRYTCFWCGDIFYLHSSRVKQNHYFCDRQCYQKARKEYGNTSGLPNAD